MKFKTTLVTTTLALTVAGSSLAYTAGATTSQPVQKTREFAVVGALWMTQECPTEDSVNCYWDGSSIGHDLEDRMYVRQFPGRAKLTCYMFIDQSAHKDYCIKNRNR